MKSTGTLVAKPTREFHGVSALDRHRLAPPLRQSDDPPLEDVDGRDDLEVFC